MGCLLLLLVLLVGMRVVGKNNALFLSSIVAKLSYVDKYLFLLSGASVLTDHILSPATVGHRFIVQVQAAECSRLIVAWGSISLLEI